jgi:hypothetical protein
MREIIESEFAGPRKRCNTYPGGFHYIIDTVDNVTKVAKLTYPNGKELDEDATYRVTLNNFLLSKHFFEQNEQIEVLPVFVVDNIVQFLMRNPNVDYRRAPKRMKHLPKEI